MTTEFPRPVNRPRPGRLDDPGTVLPSWGSTSEILEWAGFDEARLFQVFGFESLQVHRRQELLDAVEERLYAVTQADHPTRWTEVGNADEA